jgi:uncharacterized protein YndB with AHSA1/START domain
MTVPDGVVARSDDKVVIRFERRLAHPPERVWEALIDPEQLIAWWGEADVEPTEGGEFTMRWQNTKPDGTRPVMHATITKLREGELLEMEGDLHGTLRFELRPDGDGTLLTFSSTLELPEEQRPGALAGWHFHLDALARALDGGSTDLSTPGREWEQIEAAYSSGRP